MRLKTKATQRVSGCKQADRMTCKHGFRLAGRGERVSGPVRGTHRLDNCEITGKQGDIETCLHVWGGREIQIMLPCLDNDMAALFHERL